MFNYESIANNSDSKPTIIPMMIKQDEICSAQLGLSAELVRTVDLIVTAESDGVLTKVFIKLTEPYITSSNIHIDDIMQIEETVSFTCMAYANDAWVQLLEINQNAAMSELFWRVMCSAEFNRLKEMSNNTLSQLAIIRAASV